VLEHLADGLSEPLAVLRAMQERPCYAKLRPGLDLSFIAQQMRLVTVDTTALARAIFKARASRTALEVLETGDAKDKIQVLRGIQVLGDVVEVKGETVTRHVVELHEGPPPKRGDVMADETTHAPRGAQRAERYPPGTFACGKCSGVVVYHAQVDKWRCRGCGIEHPGDYKPPVWHAPKVEEEAS
jgi:ribosomal protein L37AE/L43A